MKENETQLGYDNASRSMGIGQLVERLLHTQEVAGLSLALRTTPFFAGEGRLLHVENIDPGYAGRVTGAGNYSGEGSGRQ